MSYHHLTAEQREKIFSLKEKLSYADIADEVGCHKSTISRELSRNGGLSGYSGVRAQKRYRECRTRSHRPPKLSVFPEMREHIEEGLKRYWSPEQIVHRQELPISVPTIYRAIRKDIISRERFRPHLRRKGKPYTRKGTETRGKLSGCISIDKRPQEAASRSRPGDWEGDTVLGKHGTGCLVTLVDRTTRLTLAGKLSGKHADPLSEVVTKLLEDKPCETITFDNGKEFARHQEIGDALGTKVYFSHPHSPWERGTNENTNGLLRQFFPKGKSMAQVSQKDVDAVVRLLNDRPRKCLGWETPLEAFSDILHRDGQERCT
jgi:IS30 family transposase